MGLGRSNASLLTKFFYFTGVVIDLDHVEGALLLERLQVVDLHAKLFHLSLQLFVHLRSVLRRRLIDSHRREEPRVSLPEEMLACLILPYQVSRALRQHLVLGHEAV